MTNIEALKEATNVIFDKGLLDLSNEECLEYLIWLQREIDFQLDTIARNKMQNAKV